jgi:hypothetical protein
MISKKNIRALIGSVLVGLILWLIVVMQKEYTYQVNVPINLIRLAEGKVLAQKIPVSALIEFKGKGSAITGMLFYNVSLNLELPEMDNSTTIKLKDYLHFLDLPATFGLEIGEIIEPKTIEFVVDDLITSKKPILLSGSVGTTDGYTLMGYTLIPDTVEISGPKSLVNRQDYVFTDLLEIDNQKMNFTSQISLKNPQPGITSLNPFGIEVTFDIQRLIERVVYDIPIRVINVPPNYTVEAVPNKMSLKIKGGEDLVAKIETDDFKAEIDFLKNYQVEKEAYGASINIPDNISWIESIPISFKLKVRRRNRPNDK